MTAKPNTSPRTVIGFAACPRYLGATVMQMGSCPALRTTRVRAHGWERTERARVGAWAERLMLRLDRPIVVVVAMDTDSECQRALVAVALTVARRNDLPAAEVSYLDVSRAIGMPSAGIPALCTRLLEQHPAVAEELRRKGVWSFFGTRSEAARYWTMPLVALGAALHAVEFMNVSMPR
jgi:hypothetical protein